MPDINELMASSHARVKLVTYVHFFCISNALLGSWGNGGYEFYNFLFIISMFWTMHCKDSTDAACTALIINVLGIFLDLISIVTYFSYMNGWAAVFSIINLLFRPGSVVLLYREFTSRGGTLQTGSVFPTTQQRSYQDIDRPVQSANPSISQPNAPNVASIF